MKRLLLLVGFLAGVALYSYADSVVIPLPDDILIAEPNPNLGLEFNAFLGKRGGRWYSRNSVGSLDAVLIVEEILDDRQAIVVYACGNSPEWRVKEGWSRFAADFSRNKKGELILSWTAQRTGYKFQFQLKDEGNKLEGVAGASSYITMKRIE